MKKWMILLISVLCLTLTCAGADSIPDAGYSEVRQSANGQSISEFTGVWDLISMQVEGREYYAATLMLSGVSMQMSVDTDSSILLHTKKRDISDICTAAQGVLTTPWGTLKRSGDALVGEIDIYGFPATMTFRRQDEIASVDDVQTDVAAPSQTDTTQPQNRPTRPCSNCGGIGWIKCSWCGGNGKELCLQCFGKGIYHDDICLMCDGTGWMTCHACGETGVTDLCEVCDGRGFVYTDE